MPKIITKTVYTFDELTPPAKAKARDWYREGNFDYEWYDSTKGDFETFLKTIGFRNVTSQFSGFWSQGDGASFDFKGLDISTVVNPLIDPINAYPSYRYIFEKWQRDNKETLRKINRFRDAIKVESYVINHHYSHSGTRGINLEFETYRNCPRLEKVSNAFAEALDGLCESLADTYYHALETEYDWLNADEQVDKNILANEYTFTETGKREG